MLTLTTEMQLPESPHKVAAPASEHEHRPHSSHPLALSPSSLQYSPVTAVFSHHLLQYFLITFCCIDHFAPVLSGHYVTAVHGTPEVIMLLASHCDAAGDAEYYR